MCGKIPIPVQKLWKVGGAWFLCSPLFMPMVATVLIKMLEFKDWEVFVLLTNEWVAISLQVLQQVSVLLVFYLNVDMLLVDTYIMISFKTIWLCTVYKVLAVSNSIKFTTCARGQVAIYIMHNSNGTIIWKCVI